MTKVTTTAIFIDDGGREDPRNGYDETRVWYVTPGDDEGEPTGPYMTCYSEAAAEKAAAKLAAEYGDVEVVKG